MKIKNIVFLLLLLNNLLFADKTEGFFGIFGGSVSKDHSTTTNGVVSEKDESVSLGVLRLGAYVTDNSRVYFETYSLGSFEENGKVSNAYSINYDYLAGPFGFVMPFAGLSYIYEKYETRPNQATVESDLNLLGGRIGLLVYITDKFELEFGAIKYISISKSEETHSNGATSETVSYDHDGETWTYIGLQYKFDGLANLITIQ